MISPVLHSDTWDRLPLALNTISKTSKNDTLWARVTRKNVFFLDTKVLNGIILL